MGLGYQKKKVYSIIHFVVRLNYTKFFCFFGC